MASPAIRHDLPAHLPYPVNAVGRCIQRRACLCQAAGLLALALADPASARPALGPSSSAEVRISISVVPQYVLKANRPAATVPMDLSSRLCIAANGQPMVLPIQLVRPEAGDAGAKHGAAETADPLSWCAPGSGPPRPITDGAYLGMGMLIVRPE